MRDRTANTAMTQSTPDSAPLEIGRNLQNPHSSLKKAAFDKCQRSKEQTSQRRQSRPWPWRGGSFEQLPPSRQKWRQCRPWRGSHSRCETANHFRLLAREPCRQQDRARHTGMEWRKCLKPGILVVSLHKGPKNSSTLANCGQRQIVDAAMSGDLVPKLSAG